MRIQLSNTIHRYVCVNVMYVSDVAILDPSLVRCTVAFPVVGLDFSHFSICSRACRIAGTAFFITYLFFPQSGEVA